MPTAIEITRAVTVLTHDAGLDKQGDKVTAQVTGLLARVLQAQDHWPKSWGELVQMVQQSGTGNDVTMILAALEKCVEKKAYFPELPGG